MQNATQWTASVHTLHMPKPNIIHVQVLRNGLFGLEGSLKEASRGLKGHLKSSEGEASNSTEASRGLEGTSPSEGFEETGRRLPGGLKRASRRLKVFSAEGRLEEGLKEASSSKDLKRA